jgi:hypothetical protein
MGDDKQKFSVPAIQPAFIDEFSETAGRYAAARRPRELPSFSTPLTRTTPAASRFAMPNLRVARPGAVMAVYGYNWIYLSPQLDPVVDEWLLRPIEPYWLPNLRLLWRGYRTIDFPFEEITAPRLTLYLSRDLDQLLSYCRTWSATRSKIATEGEQFLAAARAALAGAWGNPQLPRTVVMPITARLGRVS